MDFDIHQLDDLDFESEEAQGKFEAFHQALVERFRESPEGQARIQADPTTGHWASNLLYYGYQYGYAPIAKMTAADVRAIVAGLFPEKISLLDPEEASDAIPELIAFWRYLKREFDLPQADAVLAFLDEIAPDFSDLMNDPANFGMAKSIVMMGHKAGFDMTTEEGMHAFSAAFNARLLGPVTLPGMFREPMPFIEPYPPNPVRQKEREKAKKKKRKQAAEAKKKNRKWRK